MGTHAWVTLIHLQGEFPTNVPLEYQIKTEQGSLTDLAPHLVYTDRRTNNDSSRIEFKISTTADYILHGSCRNPHHPISLSISTLYWLSSDVSDLSFVEYRECTDLMVQFDHWECPAKCGSDGLSLKGRWYTLTASDWLPEPRLGMEKWEWWWWRMQLEWWWLCW